MDQLGSPPRIGVELGDGPYGVAGYGTIEHLREVHRQAQLDRFSDATATQSGYLFK